MTAVISDMNQPLGKAIGNAMEVKEAIDVLKGEGPEDITELSIRLAAEMIRLGGCPCGQENAAAEEPKDPLQIAQEALSSGRALEKFREFVANQGGDPEITENADLLGKADFAVEVKAEETGFVTGLDAMQIGLASQHSGAGREKKEDEIDMTAGILLEKKCGDEVKAGDVLCTVYGNDKAKAEAGAEQARAAYTIGRECPGPLTLIKEILSE